MLDGIDIGADAIVGAGAVVTADVPALAIAVGVPAKSGRVARAAGAGMSRRLNVLQVCDHLGWEGSRMHGVKRLFAWMIPRFDATRFNVSLVSLRKKDLSEETLDSLGVDIEYLHRSKFDPATLPALLKIIDRKQIDILHLHGYGATTFGRLAGAMRKLPTILHEHANLTDTPWFQKVADRLLEPSTDLAIAVSKSTAEFVEHARLVRPEKIKVVYLGAPLEEFGRPRSAGGARAPRGPPSAPRPTTSPSAPSRGCTTPRATSTSSRRPPKSSPRTRARGSTWPVRARCASRSRRRRRRWGSAIGSCSSASRRTWRRRCRPST